MAVKGHVDGMIEDVSSRVVQTIIERIPTGRGALRPSVVKELVCAGGREAADDLKLEVRDTHGDPVPVGMGKRGG